MVLGGCGQVWNAVRALCASTTLPLCTLRDEAVLQPGSGVAEEHPGVLEEKEQSLDVFNSITLSRCCQGHAFTGPLSLAGRVVGL